MGPFRFWNQFAWFMHGRAFNLGFWKWQRQCRLYMERPANGVQTRKAQLLAIYHSWMLNYPHLNWLWTTPDTQPSLRRTIKMTNRKLYYTGGVILQNHLHGLLGPSLIAGYFGGVSGWFGRKMNTGDCVIENALVGMTHLTSNSGTRHVIFSW